MTTQELPRQPIGNVSPPQDLMAIIALRTSDCSLASPINYDEAAQMEILAKGSSLATLNEVPLLVPEGLDRLLDEKGGPKLIPVESKTDQNNTMDATRNFFAGVADILSEHQKAQSNNTDTTEKPKPVIVVAGRISLGLVRRHCEKTGMSAIEIIDYHSKQEL